MKPTHNRFWPPLRWPILREGRAHAWRWLTTRLGWPGRSPSSVASAMVNLADSSASGPVRRTARLEQQKPERLFTLAALRQAWLAVKQAKGGPGVDGVTLAEFEASLERELGALQLELISGVYQPQPVRQILAPKASGGLRPLAIWALRDRVAQRTVYEIIAPVFETEFLPCSFGFRPGYRVQDAIAVLERYRDQNLRWVVHTDIQDCFATINPARLLKLVAVQVRDRRLCHYIAGWLNAEIFNSADGLPKKAGASQGSALSPLLANIYLHQVDKLLMQQQLAYLRYADDLVICCRQKAEAHQALTQARQAFAQWELQLNQSKTQVTHFDQGLHWLGHFLVRRECYML